MKNIGTFIVLAISWNYGLAQTQLNIQGNPISTDTVAVIKVNFVGNIDVVGLKVIAQPSSSRGIGGLFIGGTSGVLGVSKFGPGVRGTSDSNTGVLGSSNAGVGVLGSSNSDSGMYGSSNSGSGVWGVSDSGPGVRGTGNSNVGVLGSSNSNSGMYGSSNSGPGLWGVSTTNHGVRGESNSSYGVNGTSTSDAGVLGVSTNGAGVHAYSENSVGVVGRSNNPASWDFYAQGAGMNYGATSSRRWKHNVINIPDPLEMISKLRGVYFDWDSEHGGHHDIGFIAEEIGAVIPEIVSYEDNGIDATSMDYSKMTPLLVEAVNAMRTEYQHKLEEQQIQIDHLTLQLEQLNKSLSNALAMVNIKKD